ncbi:MAG TPA: efflux RND transporter periplasmic adaptor subunit [Burkholderiales bacterium]
MRKAKALLATGGLFAAVLAAGYAAVAQKPAPASAPEAPKALEFLPGDLYTVEPRTLERTLPLTGTLAPLVEATLRAKVAGELVELAAREGEPVREGEVLARIDPTELRARVAAREADVAAARAQLVWAEKNRATQRALLEKRFISQNAYDNVESNYRVALARLRAAEAELALARKSLGDSVLRAPFSGVVAERFAKPGERIAVDARVVSLVDLSRLELEAAVPASEIAQVRVGQALEFRVDGFGERTFAGRIERINPATVAGSRSINVYAAIDNPGGELRAGMFAHGTAILERIAGALFIPAAAVRREGGRPFVYALADARVVRRPVTLGAPDSTGWVQVLDGLRAGERIVRANLGVLREGAAARLAGR